MLEFMQAVLEVVVKIVPNILKRKKDEIFNEVGVELFLFYMQANEALICAEEIVHDLEYYVSRTERLGGKRTGASISRQIANKIERQMLNLAEIREIIQRWRFYLSTVGGDSIWRLAALISYKTSVLNALLIPMQEKDLPLSVRIENLEAEEHEGHDFEYYRIRKDLYQRIVETSISVGSPLGSDAYQIVKAYLENSNPKLRIQEIRIALEDLRSALMEAFAVKDIILKVADYRFRDRRSELLQRIPRGPDYL